jgi:Ca-activated chloride channel family protein
LPARHRQTADLRPGARIARSGVFACLAAVAAVGAGAAPASGQDAGERPAVLLVLDASRSMNAPSGEGGSRLDAAKAAVDEVLDTVPEEAPMGLRVYGARVAGQGRAKACADTELVAPVAAGDRAPLRDAVHALAGKGRTPIGRSLLATPDDFGGDGRRHQVILVSDGLDNCSPPSPCAAARRVARRGVELTISVVGFALDERARRQMRCIARVGGGTYVDANDTDRLREELLAAFARAFRDYEPRGTRADGGPDLAAAPRLGSGLYQGELRPGEAQTFAVELAAGERLFAAGTLVVPADLGGGGTFRVALVDGDGKELDFEQTGFGTRDTVSGLTTTHALRLDAAGVEDGPAPGAYGVQLTMDADAVGDRAVPFELAVEALEPDARPGLVREPGPEPEPAGPAATPTPTPTPEASPTGDDEGGGGAPVLAGVGVGGLLVGLAGGFGLRRRRAG